MNVLKYPNSEISKLIKEYLPKYNNEELVLSKYCIVNEDETHVEIYNTLFQSIVSMSKEEYKDILKYNSKYPILYTRFFVHKKDFDIEKIGKLVRENNFNKKKISSFKYINGYTIFTTMHCNARCFYCYEIGRHKEHMSIETADKLVNFIERKWDGNSKISLGWFGGEPLFNEKVIDIITEGLKNKNIPYKSRMISNGYLFSNEKLEKYKNQWKLEKVQITIDGTEQIYNETKNFIYKNVNPFQKVIENVKMLSENGIKINIRINVGRHNYDDALKLTDYLKEIKNKNISIYPHILFDEPYGGNFSDEEKELILSKIVEINSKLKVSGAHLSILSYTPAQCMADNGRSVVVSYDGHLGLCEHYSESEFFGSIDNDEYDEEVINSWKEQINLEKCKDCCFYPSCKRIVKCPGNLSACTELGLKNETNSIKKYLGILYQNSKKKQEKIRKELEKENKE